MSSSAPRPPRGTRLAWAAGVLALAALFFSLGAGLVSSNDGSHLALARALALRGETPIDPDLALTLGVDVAARDGHAYSDRPPGTALLALAPVALGGRLDAPLARATKARGRVLLRPASRRYVATYAARFPHAPPLYRLQGSVAAARGVAALCGAAGLALLVAAARRQGLSPGATAAAALALAGSLWGPYSTALFAHVPAAATLLAAAVTLDLEHTTPAAEGPRRLALAGGALAGLAAITDYSLLVATAPLCLLLAPRRSWPWVVLGACGPLAVAATYHMAAFGSPLSIGYDFARMGFARSRGSTFSGDLIAGARTLLGFGDGGGLLAQAPALLVGAATLARWRPRLLLALAPWITLLCLHRTPSGGAGDDHRYLIPALPLFALGLGAAWDARPRSGPWRTLLSALIVLLLAAAPFRVWPHFLAWRGA